MSKEKYSSMFSAQMEAIVSIIFQISFATRAVLKIGKPSFIWGICGHVTCLDQLRERKYLMDYNHVNNYSPKWR